MSRDDLELMEKIRSTFGPHQIGELMADLARRTAGEQLRDFLRTRASRRYLSIRALSPRH